MSEALWGKLFDAIPALAWVSFALIVYLTLRRPLIGQILPRISTVKGLGVELTLVGQLLDRASESSSEPSGPTVTATEREGVLRRLDHALPYLKDGRVLWVDDNPDYNRFLIDILQESGMTVDIARSTEDALRLLARRSYDLVLSDIARGDDEQAGIRMLDDFRERDIRLPVIVHAARFNPRLGVDPMIFAYTNRVPNVIHFVIDVMERIRLSDYAW